MSEDKHKEFTRATFFLPNTKSGETKALFDVIDYLQQKTKDPVPVTGFTRSALFPPKFSGYWFYNKKKKWLKERVVMFVLDLEVSMDDPRLQNALENIKNEIGQLYAQNGSAQDTIWIAVEEVMQFG